EPRPAAQSTRFDRLIAPGAWHSTSQRVFVARNKSPSAQPIGQRASKRTAAHPPEDLATPAAQPARSAYILSCGTRFASFSCGVLFLNTMEGQVMLVLSRRVGEEIVIDNNIRVKI